jgi:hypothetical protein
MRGHIDDELLIKYAAPLAVWRRTAAQAGDILRRNKATQIVGLVIRDTNTGQTTIVSEGKRVGFHPEAWEAAVSAGKENGLT